MLICELLEAGIGRLDHWATWQMPGWTSLAKKVAAKNVNTIFI